MVTALSHKEVAYFKEMPKAKNNEFNLFFFHADTSVFANVNKFTLKGFRQYKNH